MSLTNRQNLILIPVKLSSKRLPQKNIKILNGKPMYQYVLDAAYLSNIDADIYVSSEHYAWILGMDLPDDRREVKLIKRPKELAEDPNGIDEVVVHALTEIDHFYKHIIILQADCPLTTAWDIEDAFNLYKSMGEISVCSIVIVGNADENYYIRALGSLEISKTTRLFQKTGAITIISVGEFLKNKTRHVPNQLGYVIPQERSIDVNTEWDFQIANLSLKRRQQNEARN